MRDMMTVFRYEWKMQIKNIALWIVWAVCVGLMQIDTFPSQMNIARLDGQLAFSGYIVTRLVRDIGILMMFGFMFLISNRIRHDNKTGLSDLFMATTLSKKHYVLGKFLANYCIVLLMMGLYFAINALVHIFFNPASIDIIYFITGFCVMAIPIAFFIVACSVTIPALIDIRLFYVIFSVFIIFNIMQNGATDQTQLSFYLFNGEPIKLIDPSIGHGTRSYLLMVYNWVFLFGVGTIAIALLMLKRNFWRESK